MNLLSEIHFLKSFLQSKQTERKPVYYGRFFYVKISNFVNKNKDLVKILKKIIWIPKMFLIMLQSRLRLYF